MSLLQIPPWISRAGPAGSWCVYTDIQGNRRDGDYEVLKNETLKCIESHKTVLTLYTDGSASDGTFNGGAAVVMTSELADSPTIVDV